MRILILVMLMLMSCSACTKEEVKRSAYETLQSIKVQRCDERTGGNCDDRERYDTYQREREEILEK